MVRPSESTPETQPQVQPALLRLRMSHRDDEKRFIVSADEKLTAFLELERFRSDV
jgi:hypothetical protein